MALWYVRAHARLVDTWRSFLSHGRIRGRIVHVLQSVQIVLLDQPHVLLLELSRQRGVLMRVASGVVELVLPRSSAVFKGVVVHHHVVGATLEAHALRIMLILILL